MRLPLTGCGKQTFKHIEDMLLLVTYLYQTLPQLIPTGDQHWAACHLLDAQT